MKQIEQILLRWKEGRVYVVQAANRKISTHATVLKTMASMLKRANDSPSIGVF